VNGSVKSYVRREGRMSDAQRRSYGGLKALYCLDGEKNLTTEDLAAAFGNAKPLVVEIGFGMGEATVLIAMANPETNYLGIEVHRPGIGRLLWEIERAEPGCLVNIRVIEGDAVEVLEKIPEKIASGFHVFFPDPWPKKRHHKRRLMTRPFTDLLASRLKEGGYIYMVTDWADYGDWALAELSATPHLVNRYTAFADTQDWRPRTKFEQKGLLKNHEIRELFFVKKEEEEKG
jgi:tRNA (guanine-N7-)-methyltransferase